MDKVVCQFLLELLWTTQPLVLFLPSTSAHLPHEKRDTRRMYYVVFPTQQKVTQSKRKDFFQEAGVVLLLNQTFIFTAFCIWPVASIVISIAGIVYAVSSIVLIPNHRPCLERYTFSRTQRESARRYFKIFTKSMPISDGCKIRRHTSNKGWKELITRIFPCSTDMSRIALNQMNAVSSKRHRVSSHFFVTFTISCGEKYP